jgi:putative aldouronate transport system substrate-binding protein
VDISNNTVSDGHYYTILNTFATQDRYDRGEVFSGPGTSSIAYRTDIYEALGSPALNTLADLENVLIAAKAKYPNVIPLINDGGITGYFRGYFMRQLGVPNSYAQLNSQGNVIHLISNPDLIKFFELANRFYREGLISAEVQTYNYERFADVRNSGRSFMQNRSSAEAIESNSAQVGSGGSLRWKLIPKNLGGSNMIEYDTGIGWAGIFINKKIKNPQRAIEYYGWHRQDESRKLTAWGIQGRHWDYNEKGQTVQLKELNDIIAAGGDASVETGKGVWIFGDQGDENAFLDYSATDPNWLDIFSMRQDTAKIIKRMPALYFAIPKDGDIRIIYTKINDMFETAANEIVFTDSEAAMRAAFDRMKAQAVSLGLAELEKWMDDTYKARAGK